MKYRMHIVFIAFFILFGSLAHAQSPQAKAIMAAFGVTDTVEANNMVDAVKLISQGVSRQEIKDRAVELPAIRPNGAFAKMMSSYASLPDSLRKQIEFDSYVVEQLAINRLKSDPRDYNDAEVFAIFNSAKTPTDKAREAFAKSLDRTAKVEKYTLAEAVSSNSDLRKLVK